MLKKNYIRFQIKVHDPLYAMNMIQEKNLIIYNFHEISPYIFVFDVAPKNYFKVKKLFKDAHVIHRKGYLSWLQSLLIKKTTILALIIGAMGFWDLSGRVYSVTIKGTNRKINAEISEKLDEIGVRKWMRKPNYDQLMEYEDTLKGVFHNEVEFLELRLKGVDINVKYNARRNEIQLPQEGEAIYAKKDGFIAYFVVSSGEIMVKENQYVQQGQLLVNDRIVKSDKEEIIIGAYGAVYARTWTIIEVSRKINDANEEVDAFSDLLNKAQTMMGKGFVDDEKILEQNILSYEIKNHAANMRVHFTCLENIAN